MVDVILKCNYIISSHSGHNLYVLHIQTLAGSSLALGYNKHGQIWPTRDKLKSNHTKILPLQYPLIGEAKYTAFCEYDDIESSIIKPTKHIIKG